MASPEHRVDSPENALYTIIEPLYHGDDPTAAIIATIHEIDNGSVGNVWERYSDKVKRILPESYLDSPPSPEDLFGEAMRFAMAKGHEANSGDLRMRFAIIGLQNRAINLIEQSRKSQD